jgi:hypothetical protein
MIEVVKYNQNGELLRLTREQKKNGNQIAAD